MQINCFAKFAYRYYSSGELYINPVKIIDTYYNACLLCKKAFLRRNDQQAVIRALVDIDQQLNAKFNLHINPLWIDKNQSKKFVVITLAMIYSYTHFSYLLIGQTMLLIIPILVNRIRCIQLSFYLDMIVTRLLYINKELINIRKFQFDNGFSELCYDKLTLLKHTFSDVFKTSLVLNNCFSWSIAAISAEIFVELTINSYLLYINLITDSLSVDGLTIYCLGMSPTVLAFMLCCHSADRCTDLVIFIVIILTLNFKSYF